MRHRQTSVSVRSLRFNQEITHAIYHRLHTHTHTPLTLAHTHTYTRTVYAGFATVQTFILWPFYVFV